MRLHPFRKRLGREIMPDDDAENNSRTGFNKLDGTSPIVLMLALMKRKALLIMRGLSLCLILNQPKLFFRLGDVHFQFLLTHFMGVEHADRLVGAILSAHGDEAEAL